MDGGLTVLWAARASVILTAAALLCAGLIVALRPFLARYALAQPNPRSSHKIPTLQGGGIAVIAATTVVCYGALYFLAASAPTLPLAILFTAVILIAAVGVTADIRPIDVVPRLLLQAIAVALAIYAVPPDLRILPIVPWWMERIALVIGGLWFVNLTNFMDGLDWMTVAETVPITGALAAIGVTGVLPPQAIVVSLALCGAMIGFAYFNRPVAKLFLGDVAACQSDLRSAGCWFCSPATAAAPRQFCCRYIISPTRPSRWFAASSTAKKYGWRTARISTSVQPIAVSPSSRWWAASSPSISCLRRWHLQPCCCRRP